MGKISDTQVLETLYFKHYNAKPLKIEKLPQSGSNRDYFLLSGQAGECVGTLGAELKENRAFISFSNSLYNARLPVPQVLEVSSDGLAYLQTYIKGVSLFDFLENDRDSYGNIGQKTILLYKKVLDYLPKFQTLGAKVIDFDKCYPRKAFDSQSIMWDFNYFKYYFLKTAHIVFDEQLLENDFKTLCNYLCSVESNYFLYRDFQSRNIIITPDNQPYFIDYQGGRRGALQYDIASLLYDGKAAIAPETRLQLFDYYVNSLKNYVNIDENVFRQQFTAFCYARIMQACGSYGYRGFFENKPHFLASIAPAMNNLSYLLDNCKLLVDVPHLEQCLRNLTQSEFLKAFSAPKNTLTVTVKSFSYRRGLPYDPSGNGGGFVFDCRAIHNPGRYEKYKNSTGKDKDVIEFFAQEPEMAQFVSLTQEIVKISIDKYLKRGYKNLSVFFGCTGGQHRSVYCAEKMNAFIKANYPQVVVNLHHLEQEK